jgi:hypothetical protein
MIAIFLRYPYSLLQGKSELRLKKFTLFPAASPVSNDASFENSMSQMPGIMSKMPPLRVALNENLASFVLPGLAMVRT